MYVPKLVTRACQTTNTTLPAPTVGLDYSIPASWAVRALPPVRASADGPARSKCP